MEVEVNFVWLFLLIVVVLCAFPLCETVGVGALWFDCEALMWADPW